MPKPPEFYLQMKELHPELMDSFEALSQSAKTAGPLDDKTAALAKLALSIGAGLEGSTHSSVRKALSAGATPEEIEHVAILGVTTLGFPTTMRARAWILDVINADDDRD